MVTDHSRRTVAKVVGYVVAEEHLLVFSHDSAPLVSTGVQVPAGSIEEDESPEDAVVREVYEETGVYATVVMYLGREQYDIAPTRLEIADRRFFLLSLDSPMATTSRWTAGESSPSSSRSEAATWTCWWLPLEQAHVLSAGLGTKLGVAWEASLR